MTTPDLSPATIFAIDLAQLAREIAMDIFALPDVLKLHQVSDEEWIQIQQNPRFKAMVEQMVREWNSAGSTKERIRIKAATGLESQLETFISELGNTEIPFTQRVEGAKFLARIGEIDSDAQHATTSPFSININISPGQNVQITAKPVLTIDAEAEPVIPE